METSKGAVAAAPWRGRRLGARERTVWRGLQVLVWLVAAAILIALALAPEVGLHAFWNVLIPVAPGLLVLAPGFWRDVCPLGTSALLARHLGLSRRERLPSVWQGRFALAGILALLLIIPLRHVMLDLSGPATAVAIGALAVVAVASGLAFEWKSGWCSGLCPVHPVEQLYGQEPFVTVPNAHCAACEACVAHCPDSTPGVHPLGLGGGRMRDLAGTLMVGGFAGFIWGWFQVPDYPPSEGWGHLGEAYGLPLAGLTATLLAFLLLRRLLPPRHGRLLVRAFAAAAVACYYWYRLPGLFGFGPFPGDGMLVDLRGTLPGWFPAASRMATTVLFGWCLLGRGTGGRSWALRPPVPA